ncbi:uncharacterized protein LOC117661176 isoform X1 [Pantherophis guttatus]|uniref:Uncharacterized protein LOC117661176 isoform X1 n=1 Tax=Pantherophis guttatus TaxID=94885 RepID=A0ABM3ZCM5_PANGU|nr:uncharacterized protein LOC117661176 isoform X1 [Pantherophis guttatus]XP_060546127.1 uncharacterized protein LOC117661176 isoform X1 [Pantherophis guttatus]
MALRLIKLDKQAVGGDSPINKLHQQVLTLQSQKPDFNIIEFLLEEIVRRDEIVNQQLEKFKLEIKEIGELVKSKFDFLDQKILKTANGLADFVIQLDANTKLLESKMKETEENLDDKIQKIKKDLANIQDNSSEDKPKMEVDQKIGNEENVQQRIEREVLMIQYNFTEYAIRLRGLQENDRDDLRKISSEILAGILKVQPDEVFCRIDRIYRINSWLAKQKQLPRDVVIYFTDKGIRNDIVQNSFSSTLQFRGRKIWIFKELPPKMLMERKKFGFLVSELKKRNILFRWDVPAGLIFRHQGVRYQLNTVEKAEEFYQKNFKKNLTSLGIIQDKQKELETKGKYQIIEAVVDKLSSDSLDTPAGLSINMRAVSSDFNVTNYQATDKCVNQPVDIQVMEKKYEIIKQNQQDQLADTQFVGRKPGWKFNPQKKKKRNRSHRNSSF